VGTGGRRRLRHYRRPRHRGGAVSSLGPAAPPREGCRRRLSRRNAGFFCHWSVTSSSSTEIDHVWSVDPSRPSQNAGHFCSRAASSSMAPGKLRQQGKDGWGRGERGRLESRHELSGQVVKLDRGLLGDGLRPGVPTDTWLPRPCQHGGGVHDQAGRFEEIPRISYPRDRRERAPGRAEESRGLGGAVEREISCEGGVWRGITDRVVGAATRRT
jgi:hypothetical protein